MPLKGLMSSQGISWPRSPEIDRGLRETDRIGEFGGGASMADWQSDAVWDYEFCTLKLPSTV
jgi:hypothetical protein